MKQIKKRQGNLFIYYAAAFTLIFSAGCFKTHSSPNVRRMSDSTEQTMAVQSAQKLLHRLIGPKAMTITMIQTDKVDDCDMFEYHAENGRLTLAGSSGVAMCRGFYDYLKTGKMGVVSWSGIRIDIPDKWPDAPKKRVVSPYPHHYYFNVVTYGYTLPYWDWSRWQQELDWMALHGMDMPLALAANEAIATRVWRKLGLTQQEIDEFYVGPAHLPWQRMGNIVDHDGPLPESWHTDQVALQHKILTRMRELGMKPIVPAFAGFVPKGITRIFPKVKLHESGWGGWPKEHHAFLLMPDSELFNTIGKMYIHEWEREFGPCDYYLADSFNEMEIPAPRDDKQKRYEILAGFGKAVYDSIKAGNPDAVWVMQGWMFGYQRYIWDRESLDALLKEVPDDKVLLLDLAADYNANIWRNGMNWDFYDGFFGKPWVYSVIPNMGGKTAFTGYLSFYAKGGTPALNSPNKGRLEGFGMAPEGIENNEVLYELISDMGWQSHVADLSPWIENYCTNRYGDYPPQLQSAWQLLLKSCYGSFTDHPLFNWQRRPGHLSRGTVNASPDFLHAVELFAGCADTLKSNQLYQADLIELTAFYLGAKIEQLIQTFDQACMLDEQEAAKEVASRIDELFVDMDRLLESHPLHRLDRWLVYARSHGRTEALKDYYEQNARRLVTVWGPPTDDYSARIWSGLIRDYYRPRWKNYFESQISGKSFDFPRWEEQWVTTTGISEVEPFDDPAHAAIKLIEKVSTMKDKLFQLDAGEVVGQWHPAQISTEWHTIEWNLPVSVLKDMRGVRFEYVRGAHRLDIKAVTLVLDGKEAVKDEHDGYTGTSHMKNYYKLKVPDDMTGNNECILRALVRSDGGTDSYGKVVIIK